MKHLYILVLLITICSCVEPAKKYPIQHQTTPFFLGTYTDSLSRGVYACSIDSVGKIAIKGLAAASENPSFLIKSTDGKFLLAVNEISDLQNSGRVESYKIRGDSLHKISSQPSGGAHPCYVSITKTGTVFVANYSGGNIGLLHLNPQGELSSLLATQQHVANSSDTARSIPHAHSVWYDQTTNHVLAADLGTNQIWVSSLTPSQQNFDSTMVTRIDMVAGAGPRHITAHPTKPWIYVVNELNSSISRISKSRSGTYELNESVSSLPEAHREQSYGADIHISSDGKFLYSSNRGHNSIAIFSIDQTSGKLTLKATEAVRGDWPRNFALSPDEKYLIVANQRSKNLVSFRRDKTTGMLHYIDEIAAPTPACILF